MATFKDVSTIVNDPKAIAVIVDVRRPDEVASTGLIPTSHNIPLDELSTALQLPGQEFERTYGFTKPDHQTPLIFSCKVGQRASMATKLASQMGFNAKCYEGSWSEWSSKCK